MQKAHISVFLSLITMIVLSLVITLIEGARVSAMRLRAECIADVGISSVFAEFHRELLLQYDVLLIDTSYGRSTAGISNTEKHIQEYIAFNTKAPNSIGSFFARDWYGLRAGNVNISEYSLATDENGNVLKKQVVSYQKSKIGLSLWEDFNKKLQITKGNAFDTRDIKAEAAGIENQIDCIEIPKKEISKDVWEEVPLNNPADAVFQKRNGGMLHLVVEDMKEVSAIRVDLSGYASKRAVAVGNGFLGREEWEADAFEEFLFGEYLLDKCGNYTDYVEKNYLKYQIEYLLQGEGADSENLKKVVNRLIGIREVSNLIHLLGDPIKVAQADAMAAGLSAVVLVPTLQPLVKYSILFAWSFAESVNDIKILLAGGKVPLLKKNEEWKLSIESMLLFDKNLSSDSNSISGQSYEDYLRILLYLMPKKDKLWRFLDIVEMDIKRTEGNDCFAIDACLDRIIVDIELDSIYGYYYKFKKEYDYEI